ncbi:MAG: hypothetical protein A2231_00480 [Candidatus Firestonebacteria bacterium RIFOXYA2_FULL_40_8]|nr:MAG: hypothetical protein A2231_00480 [Candidatus Firestonebacteria bacterium RIFOXYA2_FULL_40_8]
MGKYGSFSADGREYVITRPDTPRPWLNYISNDKYGVCLTQTFNGYSIYGLPSEIKVTDKGRDFRPGKYIYMRDRVSGDYWNANWDPIQKKNQSFKCRVGINYSVLETKYSNIEMSTRIFVPREEPVEIWTFKVKNTGNKKRKLSAFPFTEWLLIDELGAWDAYGWYSFGSFDKKEQAVIGRLKHPSKLGVQISGFMKGLKKAKGFDCRRKSFLGPVGTFVAPEVLKKGSCTNSIAATEEICAVLQYDFELKPGEEKRFDILVGHGDKKTRTKVFKNIKTGADVEKEFDKVQSYVRSIEEKVMVKTPDKDFNNLVNVWLKNQLVQVSRWQRGFLIGYRDILQDARGLATIEPRLSKNAILLALKYQYKKGNAVRQFMLNGKLDERDYKDSPVWIPYAVFKYIKETGELNFLKIKLKYLDGGSGTVYEHAKRAVEVLHKERGRHGLTLIGVGDWNDALSHIGRGGKGESVMLSESFVVACKDMVEVAKLAGKTSDVRLFEKWAKEMGANIQKHAWNGSWFTRAFHDSGRPIGVPGDDKGKIFINSNTWAIHAGVATTEQKKIIFNLYETLLGTKFGPRTVYPPFTYHIPYIGRTTVNEPGFAENGGVYCHAVAFKIRADLLEGRGDQAYDAFKRIHPYFTDPDETTTEPYVFANCFHGPESILSGETMYSWLTGTVTWMFENSTDYILGVRGDFDKLLIDPVIPKDWKECFVRRYFRGVYFNVKIHNSFGNNRGVKRLFVNGKTIFGNTIKLSEIKGKKEVEVDAYIG